MSSVFTFYLFSRSTQRVHSQHRTVVDIDMAEWLPPEEITFALLCYVLNTYGPRVRVSHEANIIISMEIYLFAVRNVAAERDYNESGSVDGNTKWNTKAIVAQHS